MTNEELRQQIEWDRLLGSLSDAVAMRASRLAYQACGEPRICVDAGTPAGSARAMLGMLARRWPDAVRMAIAEARVEGLPDGEVRP